MKAENLLNHNGAGLPLKDQLINAGIVAGIAGCSAFLAQAPMSSCLATAFMSFLGSLGFQRGITIGKK